MFLGELSFGAIIQTDEFTHLPAFIWHPKYSYHQKLTVDLLL